ncbi:MAG: DivIVA domain-containing protein [Actinomycetota bacterium]
MRKKKQENQAVGFAEAPARAGRLTPVDIQQKEFRLAFRGYNERDVDEFLDMVTEQLAAYIDENDRLRRESASSAGVPAVRPADEGSSEAGTILERSREEAASIIRVAEAKAAAMTTASEVRSGDDRAVIAPYLQREREFLQNLGQLVQDHVQIVRTMVQQSKGAPAAVPSAVPETAAVSQSDVSTEAPAEAPVEAAEPSVEDVEGVVSPAETPAVAAPAETALPVTPAEISGPEVAPEAHEEEPEPPERPSLRELFWGED